MKNFKYFVLLLVFLIISSALVACSDGVEVYNTDYTENPSIETIRGYNIQYVHMDLNLEAPPEGMEMPEGMTPLTDVPAE